MTARARADQDAREVWGCGLVRDPETGEGRLATPAELRAHAEEQERRRTAPEGESEREYARWLEELQDEDREIGE